MNKLLLKAECLNKMADVVNERWKVVNLLYNKHCYDKDTENALLEYSDKLLGIYDNYNNIINQIETLPDIEED